MHDSLGLVLLVALARCTPFVSRVHMLAVNQERLQGQGFAHGATMKPVMGSE